MCWSLSSPATELIKNLDKQILLIVAGFVVWGLINIAEIMAEFSKVVKTNDNNALSIVTLKESDRGNSVLPSIALKHNWNFVDLIKEGLAWKSNSGDMEVIYIGGIVFD